MAAACAISSLIQMQSLHANKEGALQTLAMACLSAEECSLFWSYPCQWQPVAPQGPIESQQVDVLLGLEHVNTLTTTLLFQESDEEVQVKLSL